MYTSRACVAPPAPTLPQALSELSAIKQNYGAPDGVVSLVRVEALLRQQAETILAENLRWDADGQDEAGRLSMTTRPADHKRCKQQQRNTVAGMDAQAALKYNLLHHPTSDLARAFLKV